MEVSGGRGFICAGASRATKGTRWMFRQQGQDRAEGDSASHLNGLAPSTAPSLSCPLLSLFPWLLLSHLGHVSQQFL